VPSNQLERPIADTEVSRNLPADDPGEALNLALEEGALPSSQALGDATEQILLPPNGLQ